MEIPNGDCWTCFNIGMNTLVVVLNNLPRLKLTVFIENKTWISFVFIRIVTQYDTMCTTVHCIKNKIC